MDGFVFILLALLNDSWKKDLKNKRQKTLFLLRLWFYLCIKCKEDVFKDL
jgi:hypothetical protein